MDSHREIADQAACLLLKRGSGDWCAQDEAHLQAWLDASVAHRVAFVRLEAVWDDKAGALKALGHGHPAGSVPPRGAWRKLPFFRMPERKPGDPSGVSGSTRRERILNRPRRVMLFAVAAVFLAAIGATTYLLVQRGIDRYSTPIGGVASVPLRDGSHVTLNTASQIRVAFDPTQRRVDLEEGEAFFEVAKDPTRPFIVRAGDKRVVAVGTQFSVSRDGTGVRIVVTEGTVRLESASVPLHLQKQAAGSGEPAADIKAMPLTAGMVARARDQDLLVQSASVPQAEEILSWREGYLTFHETRLAEVITQFNRYNVGKIVIADPTLASIPISGAFHPTNAEAFLRLLEEGYALRVSASDGVTTLSRD